MERLIARFVAALNTGAHLLLTNIAAELPAGFGNFFNIHNRLHEDMIPQTHLGDPHRTQKMRPPTTVRLLETTICIRAEYTSRNPSSDELALAAKPLTFRDKRYAVAFLMHGEIAPVAEDDGVGVFAVAVVANGAFGVGFFTSLGGGWVTVDCCC